MIPRRALGIAGLLAFELILASVLLARGASLTSSFVLVCLVASVALIRAIIPAWRGERPPAIALWVYTLALLARAWLQLPAADLVTLASLLAVPVAGALVAAGAGTGAIARVGLWLMGALRVYFAFVYATNGATGIAIANVPAAIGAVLWALDREPEGSMTDADLAPTAR